MNTTKVKEKTFKKNHKKSNKDLKDWTKFDENNFYINDGFIDDGEDFLYDDLL